MKNSSLIILLLLASVFLSHCKKYEEDHVLFHFKSVKKRIDSGDLWYFDKLYVNDADISETFRNDSAYFEKLDLHIFNHGNTPPPANFYVYRFGGIEAIGYFKLSDDKRKIKLVAGNCCSYSSLSDSSTSFGPLFLYQEEWTIKKLTKNHFCIEIVYQGDTYKLYLKK